MKKKTKPKAQPKATPKPKKPAAKPEKSEPRTVKPEPKPAVVEAPITAHPEATIEVKLAEPKIPRCPRPSCHCAKLKSWRHGYQCAVCGERFAEDAAA